MYYGSIDIFSSCITILTNYDDGGNDDNGNENVNDGGGVNGTGGGIGCCGCGGGSGSDSGGDAFNQTVI